MTRLPCPFPLTLIALVVSLRLQRAPAQCVGIIAGTAPAHESNNNVCGERLKFWAITTDIYGNAIYAAGNQVFSLRIDGSCGAIAGAGIAGDSGDSGPAQLALLSSPQDVAVDPASNDIIVADTLNHRVRRIAHATGFIVTIGGTGLANCSSSPDGAPATGACVALPAGVAVDPASGNVLVGEAGANRVRIISAVGGLLTTLAGSGAPGFCGDGGPATASCLWSGYMPSGPSPMLHTFSLKLALDAAGGVLIGDFGNNRVRRVAPGGTITTLAGTGESGFSGDGGPATLAQLSQPAGLALEPDGSLLVADYSNRRVRRVSLAGVISTWLGSGAPPEDPCSNGGAAPLDTCLFYPSGVSYPRNSSTGSSSGGGGILVASQYVSNFNTSSVFFGSVDGVMLQVDGDDVQRVLSPIASELCSGVLYEDVLATQQCMLDASYPSVDAGGNIHFLAYDTNQVLRIRANDSRLFLTAGVGPVHAFSGDGGPAVNASLNRPSNIALDADRGLLYIGDSDNVRVRMVTLGTGIITTVAGCGELGFDGDGGPATLALLNPLFAGAQLQLRVAVGPGGSLYIADVGNARVRVVISGVISTVAGSGVEGFCGDGGPALDACFFNPTQTAVDAASGDLYISDSFNLRVRRVSAATGLIDTVVGTGARPGGLSSGPGRGMGVCPASLNVDAAGRVYISDGCLDVLLRYDPATGNASVAVGSGTKGWCDATDVLAVCVSSPTGVAFTAAGNLVFGDADNGVLREVVSSGGPSTCPPGCLCPCAAPEPCANATEGFCRGGGALTPYTVSTGYYAVAELSGCGGLSAQRPCPVGSICEAGAAHPCQTGSYGVAELQTADSGCAACAAGTYNPETGQASASACLPCPPGSASSRLAPACGWCAPSTARPAASDAGAGCTPCAPGTYALIGAPACAPLPGAGAYEATAFGASVRYPPPFDYAADSSLGIQAAMGACLLLLAVLPAAALLLAYLGVGPARARASVGRGLRVIDMYSESRALGDGEPRVKRASALGGAVTAVALGAMAAVGASLIAQFVTGNFIRLSSVVPATTAALAGVSALAHRSRAADGSGSGGPAAGVPPGLLPPYFSSGLLIRLALQGPACSSLVDNTNGSFGLPGGSWALTASSDNTTQAHTFDLVCGACTFGPLSAVDVSFDGRCQAVALTAAAVGAQGDVTLYAFAASGGGDSAGGGFLSEFSLSAPPTLDVLLDTAVLHQLLRGLLLVSAAAEDPVLVSAPPAAVRVRVSLAAEGSLVQTRVDPLLSLSQLISSLAGLAGLLGAFATAFTLADGKRPAFRRAVAWLRAKCCNCCSRCGGGGAVQRAATTGDTGSAGGVCRDDEKTPLVPPLWQPQPQPAIPLSLGIAGWTAAVAEAADVELASTGSGGRLSLRGF